MNPAVATSPARSSATLARKDESATVRAARRTANRKIGWLGHALVYAIACALLWVLAGFTPALVVALAWGIALASHGFFGVVAPGLRTRWVAQAERAAPRPPPELQMTERAHARSLEELSAAIAHEIRNPITAAKSLVQQIAEDPTAPESVEQARLAVGELDRVERSISHLLRFARQEPFTPSELNLSSVIDSAVELMVDRAEKAQVRLLREVDPLPPITADGEQLRKMLTNLIGNALDAHAEGGTADAVIVISAGQNLAGTEVWLRVRDNGPGIPAERLERIFRPFHTSKPHGTGLGLPLARKTLEQHGGSIEVTSRIGQGTEFMIVLPRSGPTAGVGP